MEPNDPLVGREIANGRYRVVNVLGRGGMGTVYTALQRPVDRQVALKIIHRELAGNPEVVARFLEEMRLTAAIEHPHTVRVYDFGDIDGQPFLTTEFLRGRSLRDEILRTGQFAQDRIASIAVQIAKALRAAKAHGVVHRDLKPENIMLLDVDGEADYVKVLDFGIARSLHRTTGMRTGTGALLGTPAYMSPEQCEGKPVDGRSDLYALGLIAYELAAGGPPFPVTDSVPQLLVAHVSIPPPDVRARAPQINETLAAFIMRLLAKSPEDRYPDPEAAIAALEPMVPTRRLSGRATAATEASPSAQRPVASIPAGRTAPLAPAARSPDRAEPGAAPPVLPGDPPARRPLSGHLITLVVGLAVAGGIGTWAYRNTRKPVVPDDGLPAACAAQNQAWAAARAPGLPDPELRTRLEAVVAACPTAVEPRILLGKALGRLGQEEAAEAQLRQALSLTPDSGPARFALAVVLLKRQKPAEALPLLDAVLQAEPSHPTARLARAQARLSARDAAGAVSDLERQVQIDPRSAPAWLLLGTARQAAGDPTGATQATTRGRELSK